MVTLIHQTTLGSYRIADSIQFLRSEEGQSLRGRVNLILTSPPFPLNNKKSYGNLGGTAYLDWFSTLATTFADLLSPDGSIVIELGNAWEPGRPVQSLLPLQSLLSFVQNEQAQLRLIQQFVCYNPARLPSPAQWVNIKRSRITDSYTNVWWMARTDQPKADNKRVIRPYSKSMRDLLKRQSYNAGQRPSEHHISPESFFTDNGGAIAHNLFELEPMEDDRSPRLPNAFSFPNTGSNDYYHRTCRERGLTPHPARMPEGLAAFFIEFLTDPGDLILDPFAGSNTTGYVAECLNRRWLSFEIKDTYAEQAQLRFEDPIIEQFHSFGGQNGSG